MRLGACSAAELCSSTTLVPTAAGLYVAIERGLDPHKLLSQYGLLSGKGFSSAPHCLPPGPGSGTLHGALMPRLCKGC